MKRLIWMAVLSVVAPAPAWPQSSTTGPVSSGLGRVLCSQTSLVASDPVSSRLRQVFDCYSEGVVAMAEEFPADKYAPQQILAMTVGHMVAHVAAFNDLGCSKIAGTAHPESPKLSEDSRADKDKLVAFLKSSVDFCKQAFSTLIDAKLGESVPWDEAPPYAVGQKVTQIAAALLVIDDLIERYIALDVYLQMNGLPTIPTSSTLDTVPLVEKGVLPLGDTAGGFQSARDVAHAACGRQSVAAVEAVHYSGPLRSWGESASSPRIRTPSPRHSKRPFRNRFAIRTPSPSFSKVLVSNVVLTNLC
jgi:hypothetical protein